jgi:hypothetical protein
LNGIVMVIRYGRVELGDKKLLNEKKRSGDGV